MRSHSFLTPVAALSRRAKIWLIALILLSLALLFVISPSMQSSIQSSIQSSLSSSLQSSLSLRSSSNSSAISILARTTEVISYPFTAIGNRIARINLLRSIEEKYRALQVEYESLLFLQSYAERLEKENRHLRELLQYRVEASDNFASRQVARVLARARGSFAHNVIVNIGLEEGVDVGNLALHKGVLIGIVTAVGSSGARVRLLRDPQSRVAIKIEGSSKKALLAGRGARKPFLLFARNEESIKAQARVVTSGDAGILPPDLVIGRIVQSGSDIIEVELDVDVDSVERVDIVKYKPHSGDIDKPKINTPKIDKLGIDKPEINKPEINKPEINKLGQ